MTNRSLPSWQCGRVANIRSCSSISLARSRLAQSRQKTVLHSQSTTCRKSEKRLVGIVCLDIFSDMYQVLRPQVLYWDKYKYFKLVLEYKYKYQVLHVCIFLQMIGDEVIKSLRSFLDQRSPNHLTGQVSHSGYVGGNLAAARVLYGFITALHVMQTRYCDENSVCPSVRHTRGFWQNSRKICPDLYTIWKNI